MTLKDKVWRPTERLKDYHFSQHMAYNNHIKLKVMGSSKIKLWEIRRLWKQNKTEKTFP